MNDLCQVDKQPWECLRCGICCKNMCDEIGQFKFGTLLLPNETHLFPSKFVKPYLGIGWKGKSKIFPARIVDYQLDVDTCPHLLEDNSCAIYDDRPLSCIAFPLDWHGGKTWFVSNKCKHGENAVPYSQVNHIFPRFMFIAQLTIAEALNPSGNSRWLYDLNTQRWHPYRDLVKAVDSDPSLKRFLESE